MGEKDALTGTNMEAATTTPNPTKPGWSSWTNGQRLIILAAGLAFISLFMPWIDAGIATRTGWEELGFLGVLLFTYPIYAALTHKQANKWLVVVLAVMAIGFGVWFMLDNLVTTEPNEWCFDYVYQITYPEECVRETYDFNGSGVIAYLVASAGFLVGGIMDARRKPVVAG
jgi:hypothetical protein